jgi:hypothetical protein
VRARSVAFSRNALKIRFRQSSLQKLALEQQRLSGLIQALVFDTIDNSG